MELVLLYINKRNQSRNFKGIYTKYIYIYISVRVCVKPTGKRSLGRPRRRWEHNIRMDVEEICINAGNWVHSAQDRNYCRALQMRH